jgi:glyoxylase-like metal-dependent hydrolase (beta-lactamase superfamily II)
MFLPFPAQDFATPGISYLQGRAVGRSPPGLLLLSFRPMFGRVLEPAAVADGVVRLGTDLCNWFLLEEDGRVVVVDTGFPAYRPQLEGGLAALGRTTADVEAIVLSHAHADHAGSAERLRRELGVTVHLHAGDEARARTGSPKGTTEAGTAPYLRHPHAWRFLAHFRTSGRAEPVADLQTFGDGAQLPGGLRALHTGGHTAGHCVFVHDGRGLVFAGDLICTVNPLTGAHGPQLMPRALNQSTATMLAALRTLEPLDAGTLLVGHGPAWTDGVGAAVRWARTVGPT